MDTPNSEGDGVQTNKQNGANSMALYFNKPLPYPLVVSGAPKQSPNHYDEAAVVGFDAGAPWARVALLGVMQRYRQQGFMRRAGANEILSPTHLEIYVRLFARWLDAGRKHNDAQVAADGLQVWAWLIYLMRLTRVPRGPLVNESVSIGGRFAPQATNSVANCCAQLIDGLPVKEPQILRNADKYQDNFAALVVRDLVKAGAFAGLKPGPPPMPCRFTVTYYKDGHVTSVPPGSLEAGDPSTVAVCYSTGRVTADEVTLLGDVDRPAAVLGAVAA